MGLFNKKEKEIDLNLVGKWNSDKIDIETMNSVGDVTMLFDEKGNLTYQINLPDKKQIMYLIYWVKDDILFSDQPSAPQVNQTRFSIVNSEILLLEFEGVKTRFIKEK